MPSKKKKDKSSITLSIDGRVFITCTDKDGEVDELELPGETVLRIVENALMEGISLMEKKYNG